MATANQRKAKRKALMRDAQHRADRESALMKKEIGQLASEPLGKAQAKESGKKFTRHIVQSGFHPHSWVRKGQ